MLSVHPYINFPGNTEEAFTFYKSVFGGDFLSIMRYKDMECLCEEMKEADQEKIAHIGLALTKNTFLMGTDCLETPEQKLIRGNNIGITLEVESQEEAERLFNGLSASGEIIMPLQETQWAEKYGFLTDQFGIRWMINFTGNKKH